MSDLLPIASGPELREQARTLARRHRSGLLGVVGLHAAAAASGLAGPPILGRLVESVRHGTTHAHIDKLVLVLACFLLAQTVLTWLARRASFVLSEKMFAELREDFMRRVLALPLSTVERAGTGDLISRTTADIDAMTRTIRFAVPETLIAAITAILTVSAAVWVSPAAALPCIAGVPALVIGTRWYLKRAPAGYLWERAAYATLAGTVGETVEGGRTVEALGLNEERVRRVDADLTEAYRAERRTLFLRTIWFPTAEFAYVLPVAAALGWGGWLVSGGHATLGEVTAVALYVVLLADPVDRLISWLDEIQVGTTSFARLVGIARVPADRTATGETPEDEHLVAEAVRYAYVDDRDVLHGIDLDLEPGERVAVVGPSGAGKSTLGRLLAGIHPPRRGRVEVGGVRLVDLPLSTLRKEVALVTQEQHVFVGTLDENLSLARPDASDDQLAGALAAVDALEWAQALPQGRNTVVGAGGYPLTPAQAQQLALARLVLADPHTLVLDEATSLLDPRAARHLERSLASVLEGRTVVAIAHRLHTAHDADRVAVIEDGLLEEIGTHDELVARGGSYAALWDSWHSKN
ncbi:MAG: ABC transporter ATP-binding protein [Actinobacteria bacterium]|nr:ABC transporter ATP-binding protein [Actinomycetota bacterium]